MKLKEIMVEKIVEIISKDYKKNYREVGGGMWKGMHNHAANEIIELIRKEPFYVWNDPK